MLKKMMLMALSVGALIAFAAPAIAQAEVTLTENGEPLGEGALVTATSSDLETTTALGQLTCEKVTLHYEVEVNGPDHVVLQPKPVGGAADNATTKNCDLKTKNEVVHPVHISNAGTKELTINTWGTGVTSSTFGSLVTLPSGPVPCTYTGNVHFQALGGDLASAGPSGLTSPLCGPGSIAGTFTLETADDPLTPETDIVPVTVDFDDTP